ncbi:MAG: formate--phosphoribosylaminoimidazolecarboxamide ligase [Candidatus Anstonellales archaeon]
MIPKEKIDKIVENYNELKIATLCSHSALQIFYGAKLEGIKTIGICTREKKKLYERFPNTKPDEFVIVDDYTNIDFSEIVARNGIIIPHGSFVEYIGKKLDNAIVPVYGNRRSLVYERDRERMLSWLRKAGIKVPKTLKPKEIKKPAIVKFPGAKGGRGYPVVKNYEEYKKKVGKRKTVAQEFISGIRAYPHYFNSIFSGVELLGVDRRIESNADEFARAIAAGYKDISFTIVANESIILRESLLLDYVKIGDAVVDASKKIFGGIFGPFCVETIITPDLEIYAFEISARIVAGTNILYHPYAEFMYGRDMFLGRRIAIELKRAFREKRMKEILY